MSLGILPASPDFTDQIIKEMIRDTIYHVDLYQSVSVLGDYNFGLAVSLKRNGFSLIHDNSIFIRLNFSYYHVNNLSKDGYSLRNSLTYFIASITSIALMTRLLQDMGNFIRSSDSEYASIDTGI